MPNIKSAKKRVLQIEKRQLVNQARKSAIKTTIKKLIVAIENNNDSAIIKELFLLSLMTLSTATIRPETTDFAVDQFDPSQAISAVNANSEKNWSYWYDASNKYAQYVSTTIIPGVGVGALTGAGIGYMSGK